MARLASLQIDDHILEYTLSFRARRTIGFVVRTDGSVRVHAPTGAPLDWVTEQVRRKAPWILKHQAAFRQRPPQRATLRYEAGSTHYFRGQPYTLELAIGPRAQVELTAAALVVTTPAPPTAAQVEQLIRAWHASLAPAYFAEALARVWPRFAEFNLPTPTLLGRQMRTRWGSCTPRTGRIRLSYELLRARPECLDYVLLHECCHLLVPDHSARFYALQTRLLPDWAQWKRELNQLPK